MVGAFFSWFGLALRTRRAVRRLPRRRPRARADRARWLRSSTSGSGASRCSSCPRSGSTGSSSPTSSPAAATGRTSSRSCSASSSSWSGSGSTGATRGPTASGSTSPPACLIGGAFLSWWHTSDAQWARDHHRRARLHPVGAGIRRSSYAVLGTLGLVLATGHYAIPEMFPYFGSGSSEATTLGRPGRVPLPRALPRARSGHAVLAPRRRRRPTAAVDRLPRARAHPVRGTGLSPPPGSTRTSNRSSSPPAADTGPDGRRSA